jgi:hypothetical protein
VNPGESVQNSVAANSRRVKIGRAVEIVGHSKRVIQQMAEAGEFDEFDEGVAIKIRGVWTFDEAKLLAFVARKGQQQCENRKAIAAARSRRFPTRTGAVRGTRKPSGPVLKSNASPSAGRSDYDGLYERAISKLLAHASKQNAKVS